MTCRELLANLVAETQEKKEERQKSFTYEQEGVKGMKEEKLKGLK